MDTNSTRRDLLEAGIAAAKGMAIAPNSSIGGLDEKMARFEESAGLVLASHGFTR